MSIEVKRRLGSASGLSLDSRLASYAAAAGAFAAASSARDGFAAVVSHRTSHAFGVNQEVNVDFNCDGQTDFQIDHDRYNLNGTDLDYLQLDKNDASSAANPLPIDPIATFPLNNTTANGDHGYMAFTNEFTDQGGYPVALQSGDMIGATGADTLIAGTLWDFQEGTNFNSSGKTIRANRLIDEDHTQIDRTLGGLPEDKVFVPIGQQPEHPELDDWTGLAGATRYVGVRLDLNDVRFFGLNNGAQPDLFFFGWIGVKITNEADATGEVTGWAFESTPGMAIAAGNLGANLTGDFNHDNAVDGADLLLWQRQQGSSVAAGTGADADGNAIVNAADLNYWKCNVGATLPPAASAAVAIPEPSGIETALFGTLAVFVCFFSGWRRRRSLPAT
jgi:hypothetical protein